MVVPSKHSNYFKVNYMLPGFFLLIAKIMFEPIFRCLIRYQFSSRKYLKREKKNNSSKNTMSNSLHPSVVVIVQDVDYC